MDKAIKDSFQFIDGLKGISALIIAFAWHYQHFLNFKPELYPLLKYIPFSALHGGWLVELFFILSGLGMSIGYKDKIINNQITFPAYIRRRILKVYPLFILTTFIVVVLELLIKYKIGSTFVYPNFDTYHLILNVLLLQDGLLGMEWSLNSPSWCISILMVCYTVYFWILKFAKSRTDYIFKYLACFFIGAFIFKVYFLWPQLNLPFINMLVGRGLMGFFMGALVWELYCLKLKYRQYYTWGGLALLLISYLLFRKWGMSVIAADGFSLGMALVLGYFPLTVFCIMNNDWLQKVISIAPFTKLGKVSLEIYLLHFPVQCLFKVTELYFKCNINYHSRKILLLYVIITVMLAYLYRKFLSNKLDFSKLLESE